MKRVAKGIVMELKRNKAIIMTADGEFLSVKKPSPEIVIGEEITSETIEVKKPGIIRYSVLAATLLLLLIPFTYFKQAYATVAYVNVDINPSLEMGINKYNKVNTVVPLNSDAEKMLQSISLKGIDVNDAVEKVLTAAKDMGYINDSKVNNIEIAIVNLKNKKASISEDNIIKHAQDMLSKINVDATLKVQKADEKTYQQAKKENMSTNKYLDKDQENGKNSIKVDVKKSDKTNDKGQEKVNNSIGSNGKTTETEKKGPANSNNGNNGKNK